MERHLILGFVLLAAILCQETVTGKRILQTNDTYRLPCNLKMSGNPDVVVQFIREKTEVKMFNSKSSTTTIKIISNDTDLDPYIMNKTDRYSVNKIGDRYEFMIENVLQSDSGFYTCRLYDMGRDMVVASKGSEELLVPGPLRGLYWTSNHRGLKTDRKFEVEDGGDVLVPNHWYGPDVACAVLVSNVEPKVNITIGRFGDNGTIDITDQFETRSSSVVTIDDVGILFTSTVFFVKKFQFQVASIRDLYCRASQPGFKTLERSVNIKVISAPPNKMCNPGKFYAEVGSNSVNVSCLVPAHPAPNVTWEIPHDNGATINETSDNPRYTVTNEPRFEGLLTTLTIRNVTSDVFGRLSIIATNTEGSGSMHLYLRRGIPVSGGERKYVDMRLVMGLGLLLWMLK